MPADPTKGVDPSGRGHPELGLSRTSHPLEVAAAWARCVGAGELDAALSLYASDAKVHTGGDRILVGRSHLHAYLQGSGLLGVGGAAEIRGDDGLTVLTWYRVGPQRRTLAVRSGVEHGHIVEQWIGAAAGGQGVELEEAYEPPWMVVRRGQVGDDVVEYARRRLGTVIDQLGEPVWLVRVKLSVAADPGRQRPALAQVTVDVDGDLVRARVAAREMREAVDLLQRRLRDQLEHRAQRRRTLHRSSGTSDTGGWRHGNLPAHRPDYFDGAPEERQLVRHKTFAVGEMTPDEAAFDMEQLDYDFYLFRDLASSDDAIVSHEPDHGYRLTRLHPTDFDPGPVAVPLTVNEQAPPTMTVGEAIDFLAAGHEPFVFFANAGTGRGNVVYRRYDGHHGLITPE